MTQRFHHRLNAAYEREAAVATEDDHDSLSMFGLHTRGHPEFGARVGLLVGKLQQGDVVRELSTQTRVTSQAIANFCVELSFFVFMDGRKGLKLQPRALTAEMERVDHVMSPEAKFPIRAILKTVREKIKDMDGEVDADLGFLDMRVFLHQPIMGNEDYPIYIDVRSTLVRYAEALSVRDRYKNPTLHAIGQFAADDVSRLSMTVLDRQLPETMILVGNTKTTTSFKAQAQHFTSRVILGKVPDHVPEIDVYSLMLSGFERLTPYGRPGGKATFSTAKSVMDYPVYIGPKRTYDDAPRTDLSECTSSTPHDIYGGVDPSVCHFMRVAGRGYGEETYGIAVIMQSDRSSRFKGVYGSRDHKGRRGQSAAVGLNDITRLLNDGRDVMVWSGPVSPCLYIVSSFLSTCHARYESARKKFETRREPMKIGVMLPHGYDQIVGMGRSNWTRLTEAIARVQYAARELKIDLPPKEFSWPGWITPRGPFSYTVVGCTFPDLVMSLQDILAAYAPLHMREWGTLPDYIMHGRYYSLDDDPPDDTYAVGVSGNKFDMQDLGYSSYSARAPADVFRCIQLLSYEMAAELLGDSPFDLDPGAGVGMMRNALRGERLVEFGTSDMRIVNNKLRPRRPATFPTEQNRTCSNLGLMMYELLEYIAITTNAASAN